MYTRATAIARDECRARRDTINAKGHRGGDGVGACGAHVETPAPTMESGVEATGTTVPSLGRKRVTIVLPGGGLVDAVNVKKSPPQNAKA